MELSIAGCEKGENETLLRPGTSRSPPLPRPRALIL